MNADILKRIVRAIADGSQDDLERLAHAVVESERQVGHTKLADQLAAILSRPRQSKNAANENKRTLADLPTSRRHGESLVTLIPRESLEHHMVLPKEKQMKGRGTRLCEDANKRYFTIFDYSGASVLEDAEFDGHPANKQKGTLPKPKPPKKDKDDEPETPKPVADNVHVVLSPRV